MPADQTITLNISCDNPDCPGNDLDSAVRTGWLFISSEVYGEPTAQHVFCSVECVNASTEAVPEAWTGKANSMVTP